MNPEALEKASLPGLLLILTGALSILTTCLSMTWSLIQFALTVVGDPDLLVTMLAATAPSLVIQLVLIAFPVVTILGGVRLRQLKSPGLVYAGAIFAMLPCCSGICCTLGLISGGYAIFTMQDDAVRAAMAEG